MSCLPMTQERQLAVDMFHRQQVRDAELVLAEATERVLLARQRLRLGQDPLETLLIQHQCFTHWAVVSR